MKAGQEHLKEEMRASQENLKEEMRANQELLKEEMLATMETNKERTDAKIDASQEKMEARIDANNEKFEFFKVLLSPGWMKAATIADCVGNQFTPHDLCDKNHKWQWKLESKHYLKLQMTPP
jgi:hypothetical protein